ncbi:lipase family protein [Nocardia sp. alder85J]|uniref:lipase family protein n=1 Tax=Nocardia sp. alder85J TaxID=2862949 RepID=UPI001CD7185C|nr:lipase family protein [Nocardia sp. alder85J]MCX4099062.1 lipase family protein [Nocardia sp. alder85J]
MLVSPMMLLAEQPATAQPPDIPAPVAPGDAGPSPLQQWIDHTIPAPPLVPAPQHPAAAQEALWQAILSSPTADPTFDAWPQGLDRLDPGHVIETRDVTAVAASLFDAPIARARLVKFRSTSASGTPEFGTATLLEPAAAWAGPGPRPVEVDTLPINALGMRCTPGYTIAHGVRDNNAINVFLPGVATALNKGHTILLPDHEGPLMAYAEPTVAGHVTLDSIRAIRSLAPDQFGDSRFAVTGYSGGAIASYATAMLLPEYAPDLANVLVGASIGGLVTDYGAVAHVFNGHSASGILLSVTLAMAREHPDMLPYMNHLAQWVGTSPLKNICGDADGPLGAVGIPMEVAANIDHPLESGISDEIQRRTDLTGRTSGVPLYIYHGVGDFWIPIQGPQQMYREQCARGVTAEFRTVPGEHVSAMLNGAGGSIDWIDARLRGEPAPNECA